MAELLEKTHSSYYPSFTSLFRDVVQNLTEAQDINLYLKPLMSHFEDLEQVRIFRLWFHLFILLPVNVDLFKYY